MNYETYISFTLKGCKNCENRTRSHTISVDLKDVKEFEQAKFENIILIWIDQNMTSVESDFIKYTVKMRKYHTIDSYEFSSWDNSEVFELALHLKGEANATQSL